MSKEGKDTWKQIRKRVNKLVKKLAKCLMKQEVRFQDESEDVIHALSLEQSKNSGIFFGRDPYADDTRYIGMKQEMDAHIVLIGSSGSGKSSCIVEPTLATYKGAICAIDVKGELVDKYKKMYRKGVVTRPYIVFDPMNDEGPSYDPFEFLEQDDEANLLSNIREIVLAIVPDDKEAKDPFWHLSAQSLLTAGLLFFYELGLNFSQAVAMLMIDFSTALEKMTQSGDSKIKSLIGDITTLTPQTLASVELHLRNQLSLFTADPRISHALRGRREGAKTFNWDDLDNSNIFMHVPVDKLNQWGGVLILMYTQLCRHLERRPEMHTPDGQKLIPVLLLMDEFASLGKMEIIEHAMCTLRSKKVSIFLIVQSLLQLDRFYGSDTRKILLDNAQYQVFLRVTDADSQENISQRIGQRQLLRSNVSAVVGKHNKKTVNPTVQESLVWERRIQPHELGMLEDVIVLSPKGYCRIPKQQPGWSDRIGGNGVISAERDTTAPSRWNPNARRWSLEERYGCAKERAEIAVVSYREALYEDLKRCKKHSSQRNAIIGKAVLKLLPQLENIVPGNTNEQNARLFAPLDALLSLLVEKPELAELLNNVPFEQNL